MLCFGTPRFIQALPLSGSTPTAPKQRHLVRELPPGAPNAQSACEEVLHAVASAGEGWGGDKLIRSRPLCFRLCFLFFCGFEASRFRVCPKCMKHHETNAPGRLTWNLKTYLWKLWKHIFLHKPVILRFHVGLFQDMLYNVNAVIRPFDAV